MVAGGSMTAAALFAIIWALNDRNDQRRWEESQVASRRKPDRQPRRHAQLRAPAHAIRNRRHPTTDRKPDLTA
jgi:hypothetical protein